MAYGSNRQVLGFDETYWGDKTTLSGVSGSYAVTTAATWTVNKYSGMRMRVLNGTNAGKVYNVVSNTATIATLQEANTSFANLDAVVFEVRNMANTSISQLQTGGDAYSRNVFLAVKEDFEFPTPALNAEEWYSLSSGQDRAGFAHKTTSFDTSIPIVVQDFRYPFMVFGYEICLGTAAGTPFSSTISADYKVGEVQIAVAGVVNLAVGDYINIGTDSNYPEVRKAMTATSPIRLDRPLRFNHTSGEAVSEVVAPFTHYVFPGERTQTGTDSGAGGSTLNGALAIGATTAVLTDATGYAAGDYIQIGTTTNPEIRKITLVASNTLTLDAPLRFIHATGATCNEVTTPFYTTVTEYGEVPGFNLHGTYDEATDFVRDALWCKVNSAEFSSDQDSLLVMNSDIVGSDVITTGTKASITVPSTQPYQFRHVSGGIYINGTSYANIESWRYRIERAIQTIYTNQDITGAKPYLQQEGKRRHELGMTIIPLNTNVYTLLDGSTAFVVYLTFSRAASDTLSFYFMDTYLTMAPHGMPIDGPVRVSGTLNPGYLLFAKVVDSIPYYPAGAL